MAIHVETEDLPDEEPQYDEDDGLISSQDPASAHAQEPFASWSPTVPRVPAVPCFAGPVDAWTCEDVKVIADDGTTVLYAGPKHLRCKLPECRSLVTKGMVQAYGGCFCGNRRVEPAIRLTENERTQLQHGYYPLVEWEARLIEPQLPTGRVWGWGKAHWEAIHA